MKKILTYLFTIIMATLVFYGGAGINIISYCCDHCRSAGIEVLLKDKCCETHSHHNGHDNNCSEDDSCNMERIHFDWYSQSVPETNVKFSPAGPDLFPCESADFSYISFSVCEIGWGISKGPPAGRPRDYLSRLTVLLI
ncbi:MAG: hypothetical protein LBS79_09220 [Tannerella sp.]|jgi:hypothetical protein|nr:hypothetical protein [Tannerella sp.]